MLAMCLIVARWIKIPLLSSAASLRPNKGKSATLSEQLYCYGVDQLFPLTLNIKQAVTASSFFQNFEIIAFDQEGKIKQFSNIKEQFMYLFNLSLEKNYTGWTGQCQSTLGSTIYYLIYFNVSIYICLSNKNVQISNICLRQYHITFCTMLVISLTYFDRNC